MEGVCIFCGTHYAIGSCVWRLLCHCVVSGAHYANHVQVFFGGGGGGSVSSGFTSLPSTSPSTSMVLPSRVVGAGSVIAGSLTSGLANACGTVRAIMKGAGNICPLYIPSILRLGTRPSVCCVHTVTLA